MDFHLKQPIEKQQHQKKSSEEEEQQQSPAKFPRLHLQLQQQQQSPSNLNCFLPRSPCRIGGYFSTDQWQELELQALIFRHMVAGSAVPIELLHLVKKSLFNSSSFSLNTNSTFSYFHPSLLQGAGSWGKGGMDLEPGRCRRTDGKKWRCSREIVIGHKYCERHVHRGRNRSRKPVESAAALTSTGSDLLGVGIHRSSAFATSQQYAGVVGDGGDGAHFSLSSPTPSFDIFQLNQGGSEANPDGKFQFKAQNESKLRPFFDDSHINSATCLSISTPGVNPSSVDFLKLSTGNGGDHLIRKDDGEWSGGNQVAAAGGPLAEAFRSSTGASTTGVLHQLPRSASGTSCVAA